ncbi:hypothetical protein [Rhizobium sp. AN80A]|uniref:hypothetical protein n=1 Tax=Rhizobium sp. AN80A TaxID=3040673 RepID=UPI0024B332B4|nr:hypothetical protein [Rhizobium sp. AN80A]
MNTAVVGTISAIASSPSSFQSLWTMAMTHAVSQPLRAFKSSFRSIPLHFAAACFIGALLADDVGNTVWRVTAQ